MSFGAAIWIDPARVSGTACIAGTRLTCEHAAHSVWSSSVDQYLADCDLSPDLRRSVLCAIAWWVLTARLRTKSDRKICAAWSNWARETWALAWHPTCELVDPPDESECD